MTADEQEQRILYTNVLEYEQDHVSLQCKSHKMSKLMEDAIRSYQSTKWCLDLEYSVYVYMKKGEQLYAYVLLINSVLAQLEKTTVKFGIEQFNQLV